MSQVNHFLENLKSIINIAPKKYQERYHIKNLKRTKSAVCPELRSVETIILRNDINYYPIREYSFYQNVVHPSTINHDKKEAHQLIGVSHDDPFCTPYGKLRFHYGIITNEQQTKVPLYTIPKGKFLRILFKGDIEKITFLYEYIYHHMLFEEKLLVRSLPAFERYKLLTKSDVIADIHIPIC